MRIDVTDEARIHLTEDLAGRILRISFTTGCGGSGYRLASADGMQKGDMTLDVQGVTIALDNMSSASLDGAVIRWDDDEAGYLLDHPSAVTATWCG